MDTQREALDLNTWSTSVQDLSTSLKILKRRVPRRTHLFIMKRRVEKHPLHPRAAAIVPSKCMQKDFLKNVPNHTSKQWRSQQLPKISNISTWSRHVPTLDHKYATVVSRCYEAYVLIFKYNCFIVVTIKINNNIRIN